MILFVAIVAVLGVTVYILEKSMQPTDQTSVPDATGDTGTQPDLTPTQQANPTDTQDVVGTALPIIQKFESFSAIPYNDPPGSSKYSIGYGHQIQSGESYKQISEPDAMALLNVDVSLAWGCVRENVSVPLNTNQAAALTSFCFNVGCTHFKDSTMLRLLNNGDYQGAAAQFPEWIHAGGVINSDLVSRRQQEQDLFNA